MSQAPFKYVLLMIIIAVLLAIFTYSLGAAFIEPPAYETYCKDNYRYAEPLNKYDANTTCEDITPRAEDITFCEEKNGRLEANYTNGCIENFYCETCYNDYEKAQETFNLNIFLFMSIIGIFFIVTTLIIKKEGVLEWILNGFLLGGLISLFVGTIIYFNDATRILRPIIMLVELGIIIVVAYLKMDQQKK